MKSFFNLLETMDYEVRKCDNLTKFCDLETCRGKKRFWVTALKAIILLKKYINKCNASSLQAANCREVIQEKASLYQGVYRSQSILAKARKKKTKEYFKDCIFFVSDFPSPSSENLTSRWGFAGLI